jgi:flagellar biosynthesis protein FliQ
MMSNGWVKPVLVIAAGIIVAGLIVGLVGRR